MRGAVLPQPAGGVAADAEHEAAMAALLDRLAWADTKALSEELRAHLLAAGSADAGHEAGGDAPLGAKPDRVASH
jgi:hypothetical protein